MTGGAPASSSAALPSRDISRFRCTGRRLVLVHRIRASPHRCTACQIRPVAAGASVSNLARLRTVPVCNLSRAWRGWCKQRYIATVEFVRTLRRNFSECGRPRPQQLRQSFTLGIASTPRGVPRFCARGRAHSVRLRLRRAALLSLKVCQFRDDF
jgi:hypothetical protein